jgi:NADH-quinone oxidoreductase subunit C
MEQSLIPQAIAESLMERYSSLVKGFTIFRGQVSLTLKKERISEILKYLHENPLLSFDFLVDLFGVDYLGKKEPRFEVVYILYSHKHGHRLRMRAEVQEEDASIDSVTHIWKCANWLGIEFKGHPDLRRILMPEDWEGYPLRKDYPLKSDLGEREWMPLKKIKELSEVNRQYELR